MVLIRKAGISLIDELDDVDTVTATPSRDEVLKWNGTNWVPAVPDATFQFSIASFSDGLSTADILIGSGEWKAIGAISFTASYNNGPPDATPYVVQSGSATAWAANLDMTTSPLFEGPTVNTEKVDYPSANNTRVLFTLNAVAGSDNDTDLEYTGYFKNHFKYDDLSKNNGFNNADIVALSSSIITTDITRGFNVTVGAANYLCFSHRTGDGSVAQVQCGPNGDGDTLTVSMDYTSATAVAPLKETVSHTNPNGKVENFYVYGSALQNLSVLFDNTFTTLSSATPLNYMWWGASATGSGYIESDVEGLSYKESGNDVSNYILPDAVTLSNEYLVVAIPTRLGINGTDYNLKDNGTGFALDMQSPETVNITNVCGFEEPYYVYGSVNLLTGTITILIE